MKNYNLKPKTQTKKRALLFGDCPIDPSGGLSSTNFPLWMLASHG